VDEDLLHILLEFKDAPLKLVLNEDLLGRLEFLEIVHTLTFVEATVGDIGFHEVADSSDFEQGDSQELIADN
jgi:hypothetical protein